MAKKLLLGVFLGILAIIVSTIFGMGIFKTAQIDEVTLDESLYGIGLKHNGPYYQIAKTFDKVEESLKNLNIRCDMSFGVYNTNPNLESAKELSSGAYCVIDQGQIEFLLKNLGEKYITYEIPKNTYTRGVFKGSPALTKMKVYPKIKQVKGYKTIPLPVYEVYIKNKDLSFSTEVLISNP